MKEKLNILLIGGGGREAALAYKISQSPRTARLWVAPGNASPYGENVAISVSDFDRIDDFVRANDVDMIVVGPEQPLIEGIADYFADRDVKVVGPMRDGARLEGSKEFAKEFMIRHTIPTARFMTVTADTIDEGISFLQSLKPPYVLKADGPAAGKGVIIVEDRAEAIKTLRDMIGGMFGDSSTTVVIEEFLDGVECSVFVATDGKNYKILPVAKDYKRIGEGDTGLNTGGMGAVSPVPFADDAFMARVEKNIVKPTLRGLQEEGIDYKGFIFCGLMNVDGQPLVIEYNVRMGDPETEVVLPRITSDFVDLLEGIAEGTLSEKYLHIDNRAAATVMLVSGGYPGSYEKGKQIFGMENLDSDTIPFIAGAVRDGENRLLTSGGRVLTLTSFGDNIFDAAEKAEAEAEKISFEGAYHRRDISKDLR